PDASHAVLAARRLRVARGEPRHAIRGPRPAALRPPDGGPGEDGPELPANRQSEWRAALVHADESHARRQRCQQCGDPLLLGEGRERRYPTERANLRLPDLRAVRRAEPTRTCGRRPDASRPVLRTVPA